MVYKIFNEDGEYVDATTKEPRNLLVANWAETPEGLNIGWAELNSLEEAIAYFNLEKVNVNP